MMNSFQFLVKTPKNFNEQAFMSNFVNELAKMNFKVNNLQRVNKSDIIFEDDTIEFEFKTDYDFNEEGYAEKYIIEHIYNGISEIKHKYNQIITNTVKIGPMILINKLPK